MKTRTREAVIEALTRHWTRLRFEVPEASSTTVATVQWFNCFD